MAERARISWIAVSVVTPGTESLSRAQRTRSPKRCGSPIARRGGGDPQHRCACGPRDPRFRASRNVNRIIAAVLAGAGSPLPRARDGCRRIDPHRRGFRVTLISADSGQARKAAIRGASYAPEWEPRAYLWATFAVAVACGVSILLNDFLPVESLSLFFLIGVLVIARVSARGRRSMPASSASLPIISS